MTVSQRIGCLSALMLFTAGCTQSWPAGLPSHTYTGVVINGPLNDPAVGAEVHANRPTFEHRGLFLGLAPDTSENGHAITDAKGHFSLRTDTGYATFLSATTADGHLIGTQALKPDDTNGLRITTDQPTFGIIEYGKWVDPTLKVFKVTELAYQQIVHYIVAHPREPLRSLEEYAARGIISQKGLSSLNQNPEYFFGPAPRVRYGWGKDVFVFPDARRPITLRRAYPPSMWARGGM